MGLMCFTKHEPVGVVGQIIPVSYFLLTVDLFTFQCENDVGRLTEIFILEKKK